jgi:hypothetical protein
VFIKSSPRRRLFSTTLEDAILYSSKDGIIPKSLAEKLTDEEVEALIMWSNRQHDIMPNQYHYSYEQGDTIIYPEHIQDLKTIDKMVQNKRNADRQKEEAKQKHKQKNPLSGSDSGNFYGRTFKFNQ